ncbi:hypothetical protein MNBD_GAMMA16-785 [hydrothermal vent metagenome]|uniref:HTH LytTR-type domain-containing protein n=1 Tax=hydrothermal vent metagenome TaxID=652676 RepID=A0A3B0ZHL7_9ZZZZ
MIISWLKQPVTYRVTQVKRIHFYVIAITLIAVSVPFLHMYMDNQLSFAELFFHTLTVVFSTVIAISFFELMLWAYLKGKTRKWSLSTGLFWLFFSGVFILSFIIMFVTRNLLPITLDIWTQHIERDLGVIPWKILPVALLIGYLLMQIVRRYSLKQELTDLKELNEQLKVIQNGVAPLDHETKESGVHDMSKFVLPYKGENIYLNSTSVIRIESNENYCHVLIAPNEKQSEQCYMARITLTEVSNQLPENLFLQVHRSHIINFSYVSNLIRQGRNFQLKLKNGDSIPVSRSRIEQVQQRVENGKFSENVTF